MVIDKKWDYSEFPGGKKYPNIFKPITIGKLTVPNRIKYAATEDNLNARDGYVTDADVAYIRERAKGVVGGLTTIQGVYMDEKRAGQGYVGMAAAWDDKFIPGLKRLSDAIHEEGDRSALVQPPERLGDRFVQVDGLPVAEVLQFGEGLKERVGGGPAEFLEDGQDVLVGPGGGGMPDERVGEEGGGDGAALEDRGDGVGAIAVILVQELVRQLATRKIEVIVGDSVLDKLAADGFDPVYGARPLRREIERQLENPLAMKIVRGECQEGSQVVAEVREGQVDLRVNA